MMKKKTLSGLFTAILMVCISVTGFSQSSERPSFLFGAEFQVYPTGIMPGLRFELPVSDHDGIHLRVGYNGFNHRDLGVQDEEIGGGFGGTIGYRHYFGDYEKFFLGARNDIWFNTVNWQNDITSPSGTAGTTKIVVVQPTAEAGYLFNFGGWSLAPAIGFGFEVNVVTNGEETGQGAILLLEFLLCCINKLPEKDLPGFENLAGLNYLLNNSHSP